ncbi:MAG: prenyltransferase/squalene oxidase repeat-containing protein [Planctomycetota bacterium]
MSLAPRQGETSVVATSQDRLRAEARAALDRVRTELLDQRVDRGHWEGQLASSALSTATAVSSLAAVLIHRERESLEDSSAGKLRSMIRGGMDYLRQQQNDDGGFGDTDLSHSNIATSYLVLAASTLARKVGEEGLENIATESLDDYLDRAGRLEGLRKRYGKDKTFVVPIMNNLAIAGLISWDEVDALPFEAAVFPQAMYRFLQMPVVSYAIPALVAIGQARHFLGRRALFPIRLIRAASIKRTLAVLERMQPQSGGYLEATPLTSFVVMSLAATGRCELPVVERGLRFLTDSCREDGSWPIDTNLATWVTSLSIHALACDPQDRGQWCTDQLVDWHLGCQHAVRHPFTGAEPGGWGWTNLSGAVPDSDDTPAAILALQQMSRYVDSTSDPFRATKMAAAMKRGKDWLLKLQNRNGGWPTFCRGWGKLPFDRSSTDLTAHAIRALSPEKARDAPSRLRAAILRGQRFLQKQQQDDGAWLPLWFGNQDRDDESNPIYGTCKVLIAGDIGTSLEDKARDFLVSSQNADGGWGGGPSVSLKLRERNEQKGAEPLCRLPAGLTSSVEETALAVEALCTDRLRQHDAAADREKTEPARSDQATVGLKDLKAATEPVDAAILGGVEFLVQSVEDRRHQIAWPIGFYFAKLWYYERLYPLIFVAAALGKFLRATDTNHDPKWPR